VFLHLRFDKTRKPRNSPRKFSPLSTKFPRTSPYKMADESDVKQPTTLSEATRDLRAARNASNKLQKENDDISKLNHELRDKITDLTERLHTLEDNQSDTARTLFHDDDASDDDNTKSTGVATPEKLYASMLENLTDQSVTIDHYHGFGDTVQNWCDHVRAVAGLKGWNASQTFRRAVLSLRGPAATAVRNKRDELHTMADLEKFLQKRFGVTDPKRHFTNALSRIRQGTESGKKFIDRFQAQVTAVNVSLPNYFSDEHFVQFFKQALNKQYLLEVKRAKAKTLDDAFSVVRDADSFLEGSVTPESVSVAAEGGLVYLKEHCDKAHTNLVEKMKEIVAPISNNGGFRNGQRFSNNYRPNGVIRCQICSKIGHSASRCRMRGWPTERRYQFNNTPQPRANNSQNVMTCYACGKIGHRASECRSTQRRNNGFQQRGGRFNSQRNRGTFNSQLYCTACSRRGHTAATCYASRGFTQGRFKTGAQNMRNTRFRGSINSISTPAVYSLNLVLS